jgi:hypothetical protein
MTETTISAESLELLRRRLHDRRFVTTEGQLLAGWSRGHAGADAAGRTTLAFDWGWLSGAEGGGQSYYVELRAPDDPDPGAPRPAVG